MQIEKTLIRLGGCPGWSESSLGAQVILLVLSWGGSILLTHIYWEEFSIHIKWTSPFPILGLSDASFHAYFIWNFCMQTVQTLIRCWVHMSLHCLPMSPKRDARLIWVNSLYDESKFKRDWRLEPILDHTCSCSTSRHWDVWGSGWGYQKSLIIKILAL